IVVGSGSILRNCTARNNGSLGAPGGGAGILVTGEANRIEENYVQGNMRGIDVDGAGNIIVKNTAVNNSVANYDIASGSSYGPILNVGAGGDLSALSGGDQPTANMSMTCPSWYADSDGDGYGDAAGSQQACAQPAGYVSEGTDCDDTNASIYPGATEVCNGLDDDCDGAIDEGAGTIWYLDWDGDGYGDPSNALLACTQPPGRVADFSDCDDTNATVHPGAVELCNGVDDDCDQTIDEGCPPPP
ncbi:MAG: putative metal-binding motif-containing protein, partial [Phycisphaerales bacterium]|nr:putative metal-binding motif-containing protein [Phycisphaerales bacterium]